MHTNYNYDIFIEEWDPPFLSKNRPKVSFLQDEGAGSKVTKAVPKNTGRFFLKGCTGQPLCFGVEQKKKKVGLGRGRE